jgi:hypothetical protein
LMMERVRSTAILGLRLNKCEEIQDYIMIRPANCGARGRQTAGLSEPQIKSGPKPAPSPNVARASGHHA